MAVAGLEGFVDAHGDLARRRLPGAVSQRGDLRASVECSLGAERHVGSGSWDC